MKAAYLCHPYQGGIYTVFRSLRTGLAEHGIDVRWVAVGNGANWAKTSPRWVSELVYGQVIDCLGKTDKEQAISLIKHLESANYQVIFINVILTRFFTNIARYLPNNFIKVMIVHNADIRHYKAAAAIRDHVHSTVAVSLLVEKELTKNYFFKPATTQFIANAIDLTPYKSISIQKNISSTFRIISLGRIYDLQKGVYWLPEIVRKITYPDWRLTIVGSGPDMSVLKSRCEPLGDKINFLGQVHPSQVPELFSTHDAFLMPSRYEGFGCTLLEAMAAKCVPVVTLIPGVTDQIIEHEKTGMHFPIGNVEAAAKQLDELAFNINTRIVLGEAAKQRVLTKFSNEAMARSYAKLLLGSNYAPSQVNLPLQLNDWKYPSGLKAGMRQRVTENAVKLTKYFFRS